MNKTYSLIGLAQKAGKVSSGTLAAKSSLIRRRAYLLILSSDIAEKTREALITTCTKQKIPWIILGDKYRLGTCVGKAYRVAITINDQRMAETVVSTTKGMGEEVRSMGVVEWQK